MALSPILRAAALSLAALPLLGCGSAEEDPLVTGVRAIAGGVFGGEDGAEGQALTAADIPPALLAQLGGPLILVETTRLGGSTLMTRVGRNGPDDTWRGPEGFGVTIGARGLLRSTRGLGFDLMASDARQTAAALAARRAGPVERVMVHLDGEGRQEHRVHRCDLRPGGAETVTIVGQARSLTRMTETCRVEGDSYENVYWLDGAGQAVQSYQWAGPEIGHLRITHLGG